MHILFIIPGLGFGGAERVVSNLACELVKQNEVTIIMTSTDKPSVYALDERISVKSAYVGSTVKTWFNVRNIAKKIKPDVALAFMADTGVMSAVFLAGTGVPVITSERNDPTRARDVSGAVKLFGKIAPTFTTGYVFQSRGAQAFYPKRVQKKSCIILNPLDVDKIPEREIDKVDRRIVTVGRLHPQKNHKMLINAFARSRASEDHTLHIYGDGSLMQELSNEIQALGMTDKIFLEGSSNRVHEDIRNAAMFVFTSDYEGLPNALMEAMAIGMPCISTDCSPGGARMLIENEKNGILIDCGDEDRLVCEIDRLCKNKELAELLGENAKSIRQRANISAIAEEWLKNIKRFTN